MWERSLGAWLWKHCLPSLQCISGHTASKILSLEPSLGLYQFLPPANRTGTLSTCISPVCRSLNRGPWMDPAGCACPVPSLVEITRVLFSSRVDLRIQTGSPAYPNVTGRYRNVSHYILQRPGSRTPSLVPWTVKPTPSDNAPHPPSLQATPVRSSVDRVSRSGNAAPHGPTSRRHPDRENKQREGR